MAWIPHTIPKSALCWFSDSPTDINSTWNGDGGFAIRSGDFGWARRCPKPLRMLCVDVIAADFALFPRTLFDALTPVNAAYLAETLDTGLPVASVDHVPVDEYWRRRLDDLPPWPRRARPPPPPPATESARTTCLNEMASRAAEDLEPGPVDGERPELAVYGRHVTTLHVGRLRATETLPSDPSSSDPVHADLGAVLCHLADSLRSLHVCFGLPPVGSRYYGLPVADLHALGRGLATLRRLTTLAITGSRVDATRFDALSPYLVPCDRLERVDLSHCRLGCVGAASVARHAAAARSLRSLVLRDNRVAADGVQSLAYMAVARRQNGHPPIALNLDMNCIADTGAKYLASALASGSQPFTELRIRTCDISEIGGMNIVESLAYDQGLCSLEIDNNPLKLNVGVSLYAALKTNLNLKYLSTQNCEFPASMAQFFNTVAYYNRHNKRDKFNYVNIERLYDQLKEESDSEGEVVLAQSAEIKKEDYYGD